MDPQPLRVLMVEDSEDDAALLLRTLRGGGYAVAHTVVQTPAAMRSALEGQEWDVITSDHAIPQFSAPSALALAKELCPDLPFIIVSGEIDLNLAISMMKAGARDYVRKGELPLLVPTIERELREVAIRRERREATDALEVSESRYRRLFETAKDGMFLLEADTGRITDVNPFLEAMLGYSHAELIDKALWEIGPFGDIPASREAMRHLQDRECVRYDDLSIETRSKQCLQVEFISNVYHVDGARVIQCNVRDITARKQAEAGVLKLNGELVTLVGEMKQRDRDMSRLNHMNDLLQACDTQGEAYEVIAQRAGDLLAGHSGFLAMLRRDRRLETVARWGGETAIAPAFAVGDCWAMRRGQPHQVVDPRGGLVCRHFSGQPAAGYLCVPMTVQGDALGLLCFIGSANDASRGTLNEALAVMIGEAIKLSLCNLRLREKLREQVILDELTGLCNRRYLDESLVREMHRALRRKSPLCVAMLDLDQFKRFNDTHGHEAGDELLRELGRVLREKLRKSDTACRYGGEEFVLVFPDSSLADTRKRVGEIRSLLNEMVFRHGDLSSKITVSAGVVQARAESSTLSELLRALDAAMYAAKQAGARSDRSPTLQQEEACHIRSAS